MRLILVAAVWVVFVGGVALYVARRDEHGDIASYEARPAAGTFSVEVTTSFPVEADPFALTAGGATAAGLILKVNGVEVLRRTEGVKVGEATVASPVPAVVVGKNELFIEAHPPQDQLLRSQAVRVRVLRDGEPVAEKTFWSEPGVPLSATFPLEVPAEAKKEGGHDDH